MNVFGIAGHSAWARPPLEQLIPLLTARGRVVSLVKHSHQGHRGRPAGQRIPYRLREAGCQEVLLLGEGRWALMHELRGAEEPPLPYLLGRLQHCDLVLIEGFKAGDFPSWRCGGPFAGPRDAVAALAGHRRHRVRRAAARAGATDPALAGSARRGRAGRISCSPTRGRRRPNSVRPERVEGPRAASRAGFDLSPNGTDPCSARREGVVDLVEERAHGVPRPAGAGRCRCVPDCEAGMKPPRRTSNTCTSLDHVVPAVQGEAVRLDALAHHRVVHQPFELQHHGALLGAAQRLWRHLHGQHRLTPQFQPGGQLVACAGAPS